MPSIIKTLKRLCSCDELVSRKRFKTLTRLPKQIRKKASKLGLLDPTISLPQCVPKETCDSIGEREARKRLEHPASTSSVQTPRCPPPSAPQSQGTLRLSPCEEQCEEEEEEEDDDGEFFGHNIDGSNASIRTKSSPMSVRTPEDRPQSYEKSPRADSLKRGSSIHSSSRKLEHRSKVIVNSNCHLIPPLTFDEELATFIFEEDVRSSGRFGSSWFFSQLNAELNG